jgi:hypothetical protein
MTAPVPVLIIEYAKENVTAYSEMIAAEPQLPLTAVLLLLKMSRARNKMTAAEISRMAVKLAAPITSLLNARRQSTEFTANAIKDSIVKIAV